MDNSNAPNKSIPIVRVILILLIIGGITFWYRSHHGGAGFGLGGMMARNAGGPTVTVTGLVGGEKLGYLADPDVQQILQNKYGLTVTATKAGSIDMVRGSTDGQDFLWPSSQVALALYKERGGKMRGTDTVFSSPIVLYSWTPVVDTLIKVHVVQKLGASYYIVDFPKLIAMINKGTTWKDIGLTDQYGRISIRSTDPNKSNSGMMFSGLLANIVNGDVVTDSSVGHTLPTVKTFFGRLGFMQGSSGDLFDEFITQGQGQDPIIVCYENQLTEYMLQHPEYKSTIQQQIRILYPRPTVWSDHPIIALTENGSKLLEALQHDPDLRRLAWTHHGFRTGLQNDPSVLQATGIPATISNVVPMPTPKVMDRIMGSLPAS